MLEERARLQARLAALEAAAAAGAQEHRGGGGAATAAAASSSTAGRSGGSANGGGAAGAARPATLQGLGAAALPAMEVAEAIAANMQKESAAR